MKNLFLIFFAFLFVSSLNYAQEMDDLKKKIQIMNDQYAKLMVAGDTDALWDYYVDDLISLPSYEPMIKGMEAAKESSKKMEESGMKITSFIMKSTDIMKSGDMVVDIGTYKISMQIPGMEKPWDDHGKYLNLWKVMDDGSMKMKVEMWNTDVNPWAEMEKMKEHEDHEGHMEMEEDKETE